MKTISILNRSVITGTLCAGATLFMAAGASAEVLYESEQYTGAINTFNSSGTPTTFVASSQPLGEQIAFDSFGNLYAGNNGGTSITKITPNGTASSLGFDFNQPTGVAVDGSGDVFVANWGNGQIIEIAPNGLSESLFASGLDNPLFLTFNSQGDLFESDWGSGNIYEFANGTKSLYASGFIKPTGMAFNSAGQLFVSDNTGGGSVWKVTPTGPSSIISGLNDTQGLAFDNAGNLFIAVAGGEIEEISSTGVASVFSPLSTKLQSAVGLAFDPVPEPSTLALLAVGASAVGLRLRRKQ
jgi:sugar lactone lactonase YvrE